MSDSWSSKLVTNKSVHKHRAEIARRSVSLVFHRTLEPGIFTRCLRNKVFVSRQKREEGEKEKKEKRRNREAR